MKICKYQALEIVRRGARTDRGAQPFGSSVFSLLNNAFGLGTWEHKETSLNVAIPLA